MKGRNRESQGDLVRDRSRVVTNTNYAGKHGGAEVSWETPSVCGESSRHEIEHSVEVNGADRLVQSRVGNRCCTAWVVMAQTSHTI